ncbi:MAG: SPOR domain-containing protein [Bernardetiaceae bacterium]|nr:SPOR domain-containing protein [Bernardetiaceae bacterium]
MKKYCLGIFAFCFLSFFMFTSTDSSAQEMSKDEKKQWKKRMKDMSLEEFKSTMQEYSSLKTEAEGLKRQVRSMSQAISDRDVIIDSLRSVAREGNQAKPKENKSSTENPDNYEQGKVYRVQVGAFKNKDLTKYTEHPRFHAEHDGDNVKKYTIGTFRDYWEADLFKKYLREMGVKDAWIVAYVDGKRTDIKNVLGEADIKMVQDGESKNSDVGGGSNNKSSDDGW